MTALPCDFIGLQHLQNDASSLSLNKALLKQPTHEQWELVFAIIIFTDK
jgi:hypothetical protein